MKQPPLYVKNPAGAVAPSIRAMVDAESNQLALRRLGQSRTNQRAEELGVLIGKNAPRRGLVCRQSQNLYATKHVSEQPRTQIQWVGRLEPRILPTLLEIHSTAWAIDKDRLHELERGGGASNGEQAQSASQGWNAEPDTFHEMMKCGSHRLSGSVTQLSENREKKTVPVTGAGPDEPAPVPLDARLSENPSHGAWNQNMATRNARPLVESVPRFKPSVTLHSNWKKTLDVMLYRPMAVVLVPD